MFYNRVTKQESEKMLHQLFSTNEICGVLIFAMEATPFTAKPLQNSLHCELKICAKKKIFTMTVQYLYCSRH